MLDRKLGVFELLVVLAIIEGTVGSKGYALILAFASVVAWYTKKKFGGEFSLRQAWGILAGWEKKVERKLDGLDTDPPPSSPHPGKATQASGEKIPY